MAKDTKKGLGRGLSELFGDDILNNENEGELIYAPIAKVEPRAEQPRNRFDDDALQELADFAGEIPRSDRHRYTLSSEICRLDHESGQQERIYQTFPDSERNP